MKQFKENMKKNFKRPSFILGTVFLFGAILLTSALIWQVIYFNTVDFEQILYNLLSPMDGANTEVFTTFAWQVTPIALIISMVLSTMLITFTTGETKKNKVLDFIKNHYLVLNLILFVVVLVLSMNMFL